MSLTDKEVEHVAGLSRIELDIKTHDHLKEDLSSILDYIEKLEKVPTQGVEPLYQVSGLSNHTRPDEHRNDFPMDERLARRLVGQAPEHQDGYVKVKGILKK